MWKKFYQQKMLDELNLRCHYLILNGNYIITNRKASPWNISHMGVFDAFKLDKISVWEWLQLLSSIKLIESNIHIHEICLWLSLMYIWHFILLHVIVREYKLYYANIRTHQLIDLYKRKAFGKVLWA